MTERAALLLFQPLELPQIREHFAGRQPQAAYIGAANGHQSAFYERACAGLESQLGAALSCAFVRSAVDIPVQPVEHDWHPDRYGRQGAARGFYPASPGGRVMVPGR